MFLAIIEKDAYESKCDISHFEFVFCKNMLYVTNINDIISIIFVFDKNIILTIVFGSM